MKDINILSNLGNDLRTRSFFRRDIEGLLNNEDDKIVLNFSGVKFISRSVADEIYNVLCDYPNTTIEGMSGDVLMMYSVVSRGRKQTRIFPSGDINVVHLRTMDEMNSFFSKF